MPTRKPRHISNNRVGRFASTKMGRMMSYEANLELDFIHLLEFDRNVISYEEQPFAIEYEANGKQYKYTPDFWVEYDDDRFLLIEVKAHKYVAKPTNIRKANAARAWCQNQKGDVEFLIFTEKTAPIKVANVRKLAAFAHYQIPTKVQDQIRQVLTEIASPISIKDLTIEIAPDAAQRLLIPVLHMAFHHRLNLSLDNEPINVNSLVSLPKDQ